MMNSHARSLWTLLCCAGLLVACATQPNVRTMEDDEAGFDQYRTFGFVERAGTDDGDYTSLKTRHLRDAAIRELEARGYRQAEDPDLLVNFFVRTREQTRISDRPSFGMYYGYRRDLYGVWGAYPTRRDLSQYTVGTLHVDLVDAEREQLVWEGILERGAAQRLIDDPANAAGPAMKAVFDAFPYQAASAPEATGS